MSLVKITWPNHTPQKNEIALSDDLAKETIVNVGLRQISARRWDIGRKAERCSEEPRSRVVYVPRSTAIYGLVIFAVTIVISGNRYITI